MLAHRVETPVALEEEERAIGSDRGGALGQIGIESLKRHRLDEGLGEGLRHSSILMGSLGSVRPVQVLPLQSDTIQRVDIRGSFV